MPQQPASRSTTVAPGMRASSALAGASVPSPSDGSGRAGRSATGPGAESSRTASRLPLALRANSSNSTRAVGDALRAALRVAAEQRRRVLAHRRQAARLEEHDRRAALGERIQPVRCSTRRRRRASSSRPCEISGRPQHALRRQLDVEAGALEHVARRHADRRVVVVGERVVEERHRRLHRRVARRLALPAARNCCAKVVAAQAGGTRRRSRPSSLLVQPAHRARCARSRSTSGANRLPQRDSVVDVAEHARAQRRAVPRQ